MKKVCLVLGISALVSTNVFAGEFYGFADGGQSKLSLDLGDGVSFSKSDTAIDVGIGFKINSHFSVEGAYRDLGKISVTDEYDDKASLKGSAFQVSVLASLPVNSKFDLYGRLGFAHIKADLDYEDCCYYSEDFSESESANKAVFGVGGEYKVTESFGVRLEYSKYAKWDEVTMSSTTVGVTYKF